MRFTILFKSFKTNKYHVRLESGDILHIPVDAARYLRVGSTGVVTQKPLGGFNFTLDAIDVT